VTARKLPKPPLSPAAGEIRRDFPAVSTWYQSTGTSRALEGALVVLVGVEPD
jgi:hypothetical protein